ncbi:hypothetical protein ACFFR3_46095 [Nonomuraea salmonea]|uniref:Uncharacterized protein n=2 Tax=Nonomuraea salmonea TaxID=46181 RepID=A0ABV5P2V3_9ACTN
MTAKTTTLYVPTINGVPLAGYSGYRVFDSLEEALEEKYDAARVYLTKEVAEAHCEWARGYFTADSMRHGWAVEEREGLVRRFVDGVRIALICD